jgi:hypothetical protein
MRWLVGHFIAEQHVIYADDRGNLQRWLPDTNARRPELVELGKCDTADPDRGIDLLKTFLTKAETRALSKVKT